MALTISTTRTGTMGDQRSVFGTITFDSSYAVGGEAFDKADIGLVRLDWISFNQGEDGRVFHWDAANEKIMVFESGTASAALDEEDTTVDLSNVVVEFFAVGV